MLTKTRMYKALVEKDRTFEGSFIAAIKTTGIFCRPSCTAKKPKSENVEYFQNTKEAILNGYRPCKICNPLECLDETPFKIKELLEVFHKDPGIKFKDWDLKQKGFDPNTIRRWFLKNHGITFHAYQRMHRINSAFKKIQKGNPITDTAFSSGYESISGFNDRFKSIFGVSPSQTKRQMIIDICRIDSPLGTLFAGADDKGICLLEFSDRKMLESEFKNFTKKFNATIIYGENIYFPFLRQELKEYFEGQRKVFNVPLSLYGTEFQKEVWKLLQTISYGTTRSYQKQANSLMKPDAVRAVANANGMNKIAILIPCHRVIGSNGQLTGYGGGLWRKKWLLEHEQSFAKQLNLFD